MPSTTPPSAVSTDHRRPFVATTNHKNINKNKFFPRKFAFCHSNQIQPERLKPDAIRALCCASPATRHTFFFIFPLPPFRGAVWFPFFFPSLFRGYCGGGHQPALPPSEKFFSTRRRVGRVERMRLVSKRKRAEETETEKERKKEKKNRRATNHFTLLQPFVSHLDLTTTYKSSLRQ